MENSDNQPQALRVADFVLRLPDDEAKRKVADIMQRLNTQDETVRLKAERELWDMGEQGFELLLAALERMRQVQRRLPLYITVT